MIPGRLPSPGYMLFSCHRNHNSKKSGLLDAGSIYYTFQAMEEVMRPGEEMLWQQFSSSQRVAWKTGTSFGFRDGWAIGITPRYVVGVWVGNTDGEGRPEPDRHKYSSPYPVRDIQAAAGCARLV